MLSPVRLSVVCNARAPYSDGCNFGQYFYGIRYRGHPLTSVKNFAEIVSKDDTQQGKPNIAILDPSKAIITETVQDRR